MSGEEALSKPLKRDIIGASGGWGWAGDVCPGVHHLIPNEEQSSAHVNRHLKTLHGACNIALYNNGAVIRPP